MQVRYPLEACLEQRCLSTPFVVSTDGLLGKEAKGKLAAEEAILYPTHREMGGDEAVLPSVWLCQHSYEHCNRPSNSRLCQRGSRIPTDQMSRRPRSARPKRPQAYCIPPIEFGQDRENGFDLNSITDDVYPEYRMDDYSFDSLLAG
jgi:hypothetical protein